MRQAVYYKACLKVRWRGLAAGHIETCHGPLLALRPGLDSPAVVHINKMQI